MTPETKVYKVTRTLEYTGSKEWIEKTLEKSVVRPQYSGPYAGAGWIIKEINCSEIEEIVVP